MSNATSRPCAAARKGWWTMCGTVVTGQQNARYASGIAGSLGSQSQSENLIIAELRPTSPPLARRWPRSSQPHPSLSSLLLAMSSTKVKKAAKPPAMSMQGMSRSFHLSTTHILTVMFPASQRFSRRTRNYSLISRIWPARLES